MEIDNQPVESDQDIDEQIQDDYPTSTSPTSSTSDPNPSCSTSQSGSSSSSSSDDNIGKQGVNNDKLYKNSLITVCEFIVLFQACVSRMTLRKRYL